MARVRHRNRRARGTNVADASPPELPVDYDLNSVSSALWNLEFGVGATVDGIDEALALPVLPVGINNDGQIDGNNTLIWTIEESSSLGFAQSVYRFSESADDLANGDFTLTELNSVTLQLNSGIQSAVIIIEDAQGPPPTVGTANPDDLSGSAGIDFIYGGGLSGSGVNSIITTSTGDDRLQGLAGDDSLYGWDGNDRLIGGPGLDYLLGGTGADRFEFYDPETDGADLLPEFDPTEDVIGLYVGNASFPLSAYKTAGLPSSGAIAPEQFHVGTSAQDASDRLIYDDTTGDLWFDADGSGIGEAVLIATLLDAPALTANQIVTFGDPPAPPGGSGGTPGPDVLIGDGNPNTLLGLAGNDVLLGIGGNDILLGMGGRDLLKGGGGRDLIKGGKGSDRLVGGTGIDTFVLEKGPGFDTIVDFRDRTDRLGLTRGMRLGQLTLRKTGQNTEIRLGSDLLAVVWQIQPTQLTASDFVSLSIG